MAPLEKIVDDVLKSGNVEALDAFLQRDVYEGTSLKCSRHFLTKLDKLVQKFLDQTDSKSASLGLNIINKCGANLKLPGGGQGLLELISCGLVNKWFEKCRKLWIQCGPQWDETMFNLSEDFFDALMVVHEACVDATYKVTESFLYPVGQVGVDPRIYILVRKEAIRKFNLILDKIPVDLKKDRKILASQDASAIMTKMAGEISEGGDCDFQMALTEALCRMATPVQRRNLADRWFTMQHVASAFTKIKDSEFETDCRKFLNMVNGRQGDKRRVYSYPCLEAYLDTYELLMPADEKLEEFWIDFNLASHSISFYFSLSEEEGQESPWETICVIENEVQSYTVTEGGKRKVLQLKLSDVLVVGAVEGSSLCIHFSSSLDILQAARNVYGDSKNIAFVRKTGTSVVKTTIKVTMEENSSQVVPESQVSLWESERNTLLHNVTATTAPSQMLSPAKMRMSESTCISSNAGGSVPSARSHSDVMASNTLAKSKHEPNQHHSTMAGGMTEQSTSLKIAVATGPAEQALVDNFVPDTQPIPSTSLSSKRKKMSVSEMLFMPTQKMIRPDLQPSSAKQQENLSLKAVRSSVPNSGPINQKLFHMELTKRLQQSLTEQSPDCAPQQSTATEKKLADARTSAEHRSSTSTHPEAQQAQNKMKKGSHEKPGPVSTAAPVQSITTKTPQEKRQTRDKGEGVRELSSREKRSAEVTESMVKQISRHYGVKTQSKVKTTTENVSSSWTRPVFDRPNFNTSWFPIAKKKISEAVIPSKTPITSVRNDVFLFTADAPLPSGSKKELFANTAAKLSRLANSSVSDSSTLPSTTRRGQPVQKAMEEKRHVKKHLFSDTDTDGVCSEVSWLRDSRRKPKPKITKYSRQAAVKPKAALPHTSHDSSYSPTPSTKPRKQREKAAAEPSEPVAHQMSRRAAATSAESYRKPNTDSSLSQPPVPKRTQKEPKEKAAKPSEPVAHRRPRRAAAASAKSYREPDSDNSLSEPEWPPVPKQDSCESVDDIEKYQEAVYMKKKKPASKKSPRCYERAESGHVDSVTGQATTSKQWRPGNVPEMPKSKKTKDLPRQERKQERPSKDSSAVCQTSISPSSPIETMRSAESSASILKMACSPLINLQGSPLPASPEPAFQDTPSPVLLLPKLSSTVSSRGHFRLPANFSVGKKTLSSKTLSVLSVTPLRRQSPAPNASTRAAERNLNQHHLSSVPQSPLTLPTQPLLASTFLEQEKSSTPSPPDSPSPEDMTNHDTLYGFSKVFTVSSQSSIKSVVGRSRVKESYSLSSTVSYKTEETPLSHLDVKPAHTLISGPRGKHPMSSDSDSEDGEKEKKKRSKMRDLSSPRMKPRKLFKSFTEVSAEDVQMLVHCPSRLSSTHRDSDVKDEAMDLDDDVLQPGVAASPQKLCQQFSSELKKKSQGRGKLIDVFNKHSLKAVQQHVASINMQVINNRTQRVEHVQQVLLDEIHKLEQDDTVLSSMEKDLSVYWKKQMITFHSLKEQGASRKETLKKALQNHLCHGVEYEQRIFTSQMCHMRKDMKSLQARVLTEMHEVELQNMKRGLHALFLPDGTKL